MRPRTLSFLKRGLADRHYHSSTVWQLSGLRIGISLIITTASLTGELFRERPKGLSRVIISSREVTFHRVVLRAARNNQDVTF